MKANQPASGYHGGRRQPVAKRLRENVEKSSVLSSRTANLRLLHELQVHQLELEAQNDELRLTRTRTETLLSGKLHEERIRMEALLAEYTNLYDYAPTGYLTVDRKGRIVQLNFVGARLLGGERSKLLEQRLGDFISRGDQKTFNNFVKKVSLGQTSGRCEVSLGKEASRAVAVLIEGICHRSRQECRMVMFDVSEHKRSEQTRNQLAKIVEGCSDAIVSATMDGTVTNWNAAAERMFGFSAGEIVGQSITAIVPAERRREHRAVIAQIEQGASVGAYETIRKRRDGRTFTTEMTLFPVKNAMGRVVGVSKIMRDITARKALERELLETNERERRDLGRELHDGLGQHLNGLQLLAALFQKDLAKEGSPHAAAAGRLSSFLREAAVLTREVAHGLQPVQPVPEGLVTALRKLTERTQALFGVTCVFECRAPVPFGNNATATHLYRITQEAVNNAITHARPKHIDIALHAASGRIVLAVADDGGGIRPSPSRNEGMGMHVMQYRAKMLGGILSVQGLPAGGTEIICSIPAKLSDSPKADSNRTKP